MSWSVSFIGTPEKIVEALEKYGAGLDGQSKKEFDEALPCMIGLVKLNFNAAYPQLAIAIIANGHSYNGYGSCSVKIENAGTQVV